MATSYAGPVPLPQMPVAYERSNMSNLSSNERLSPQELVDGLRKCSLCDAGVTQWGNGVCPRCGGPESFERQAADMIDRLTSELEDTKEREAGWRVGNERLRIERDRLLAELAETQALCESLQNKWATRPLAHADGEALLAENDRLRAALARINDGEAEDYSHCIEIAHEALAGAAEETGSASALR